MCAYVDVCACVRVGVLVYMWVCVRVRVCVGQGGGEIPSRGNQTSSRLEARALCQEQQKLDVQGGKRRRDDGRLPAPDMPTERTSALTPLCTRRPLPGLWGADVRLTLPPTFASLAPLRRCSGPLSPSF